MNAKSITLSAVIAALYTVLVIALGQLSFYYIQIRVADALFGLVPLYGMPAIIGLTIGGFLGNFIGFSMGLTVATDVIVGPVVNFVAAYLGYVAYRRFRNAFIALLVEAVTVGVSIGAFLSFVYGIELFMAIAMVTASSLAAIVVLGYLLYIALKRVQAQK